MTFEQQRIQEENLNSPEAITDTTFRIYVIVNGMITVVLGDDSEPHNSVPKDNMENVKKNFKEGLSGFSNRDIGQAREQYSLDKKYDDPIFEARLLREYLGGGKDGLKAYIQGLQTERRNTVFRNIRSIIGAELTPGNANMIQILKDSGWTSLANQIKESQEKDNSQIDTQEAEAIIKLYDKSSRNTQRELRDFFKNITQKQFVVSGKDDYDTYKDFFEKVLGHTIPSSDELTVLLGKPIDSIKVNDASIEINYNSIAGRNQTIITYNNNQNVTQTDHNWGFGTNEEEERGIEFNMNQETEMQKNSDTDTDTDTDTGTETDTDTDTDTDMDTDTRVTIDVSSGRELDITNSFAQNMHPWVVEHINAGNRRPSKINNPTKQEIITIIKAFQDQVIRKSSPNLQNSGQIIYATQVALSHLGHGSDMGSIDGFWGGNTKNAVKAFQKENNLTVDGILGPNTFGKLLEKLLAKE